MKEIWKKHPAYTKYLFSNLGRVKVLKTNKNIKVHYFKRNGQAFVFLRVPRDKEIWYGRTVPLSPVIAEIFLGPRPEGLKVTHKNFKKSNRISVI